MNALWKGTLNFGLIHIPISLYPGDRRRASDLDLTLLDRRDMSPVGYQKVNKRTGETVPNDRIVKGFEYEEGEYVLLEEGDFERASPETAHRVDISSFVDLGEIQPAYFERPYYLEPAGKSERAYALLHAALERTHKAGIADIVIHARQHISALLPHGPLLVLNTLRYQHELREHGEIKAPTGELDKLMISDPELKMAERLIEDLAIPWEPERYQDNYRERLLAFIRRKVAAGRSQETIPPPRRRTRRYEAPEDIMSLLKESVAQAETARAGAHRGRPAFH